MKGNLLLLTAVLAVSWFAMATNPAEAGGSGRIARFRAEARMAELNAQAARRSQAAYEDAWRQTGKAARDAYDRSRLLHNPTPLGVLQYLWDKPAQRIERRPPARYESMPQLRPPDVRDFRNLAPRR